MSENPHAISPEVTQAIRTVIAQAGIDANTDLIARILDTGVGLGLDEADRLDLKITSAALTEMRAAFQLFAPYEGVPKVTIFGSARTRPTDARYRQASEVAAALAAQGWIVVTGAGPGIMQAAAEGAGADYSLGVSIRLPFEEKPNAVIGESARNVAMKYFFTRKLMLVKESRGFVCVPGGFGTLDELFELLTLQQTGKAEPTPIVLLDEPGGTFWHGLRRFADEHLIASGVISPDDLDRVLITDSVDAAAAEILGFWRNYDSLRWVGKRLVLRLRHAPTDAEVDALNETFAGMLKLGRIEHRGPLRAEQEDADRLELPRLVLTPDQFRVGELHALIRAISGLESAG
ncbi:TIGR00730 family Rossman fold protein [Microbacterium terricola]|uniref:Rossman fold protein, TIGR00730 family n=1 Tax=Microbacterium terricola TaxID=344163 RepID=A0ABM8DX46_9MICO|nr:TIGR00730 family Rossman fold protein [Microbacterium terricola]UYK39095.1 TIGR00730 family Rossman fold protein [Microbacterium terricola]BDV30194.1 Rossman fold protein, TIGR00730 family [Microbacterium terricola]